MKQKESRFDQFYAMEPLLPAYQTAALADLVSEILFKAGELSAQIPSPLVRDRIAELVREMNSYYSNLIEGHKTLPRDIERAMKQDFSADPDKRANQQLNRAHIEVEKLMVSRLRAEPDLSIHSADFLCWLHREFYSRLPEELHYSKDRREKRYRIEPGALRTFEVEVGRHQPPLHESLPKLLARFAEFYASKSILATDQLVALAAAHHRLAWIHPFGDGNGRVTRLFSHAWVVRCELDSFGLWTLSRGLARTRKEYYEQLSNADQPRWNDLDGRGNLSDRAFGDFCVFLLKTMLDQIQFMAGLLQLEKLKTRIERYVHFELLYLKTRTRDRLSRLLKAALIEGQIDRGSVPEIVGLSGTPAREIIRIAIKEELVQSPTERGPLSLVFSAKTIESYFPQLYQDLPTS